MSKQNEGYKWIQENFIFLKENICASSLTDYLFQDKVISFEEKEELKSEKSRLLKNDELLTIILRKLKFQAGFRDVFYTFMSFLQEKHPQILVELPFTDELYKSFDDFKNRKELEKELEDHKANCDRLNLKVNELEQEKEDHKADCDRLNLKVNELEQEKAKDKQIIRSLQTNFGECIQMCHEQEDEIKKLKNKILDMAKQSNERAQHKAEFFLPKRTSYYPKNMRLQKTTLAQELAIHFDNLLDSLAEFGEKVAQLFVFSPRSRNACSSMHLSVPDREKSSQKFWELGLDMIEVIKGKDQEQAWETTLLH